MARDGRDLEMKLRQACGQIPGLQIEAARKDANQRLASRAVIDELAGRYDSAARLISQFCLESFSSYCRRTDEFAE